MKVISLVRKALAVIGAIVGYMSVNVGDYYTEVLGEVNNTYIWGVLAGFIMMLPLLMHILTKDLKESKNNESRNA